MMFFKNKRDQNNVNKVIVEIDYNKLAESIIKIQNKEKEFTKSTGQKKKLFKTICDIIRNVEDTEDKMTIGAFSFVLEFFFKATAVVSCLFSIIYCFFFIVSVWKNLSLVCNCENIINAIFVTLFILSLVVIILLFCVLLWGTGNEISKEKDKNYIMSVFSGVTGFIALIVALIALFQKVDLMPVTEILNEIKEVLAKGE